MNNKNYIKSLFLDVLFDKVKRFLPRDLRYVQIIIEQFREIEIEVHFYTSDWEEIEPEICFLDGEERTISEQYLCDYISNALIFCNSLDGVENDFTETYDNDDLYYIINKNSTDLSQHPLKQKQDLLALLIQERETLDSRINQLYLEIDNLTNNKK